jgi:hypothetical protein
LAESGFSREEDVALKIQRLQDLGKVFGIADLVRPPHENETDSG